MSRTDLGYRYLVARPHPWRRQLCLKGRNMTVGQLIASMHAERYGPDEAAACFSLPVEQVREALAYYGANQELIDAEFGEERRLLAKRKDAGGLAALPGRLRKPPPPPGATDLPTA